MDLTLALILIGLLGLGWRPVTVSGCEIVLAEFKE